MSSLHCWLCRANHTNPVSFTECNANRENQTCKTTFEPSCGIFIFKNKVSGVLIHAKSCVWKKDCGSNDTFCKGISHGGADCRLQCCDQELCNFQEEFKSTTPLPTSLPTAGTTTEKAATTEEEPTTEEVSTTEEGTPSPPAETTAQHGTPAPDYGDDDDDEDCSWIDAGATCLVSIALLLACALLAVAHTLSAH